MSARFRNWCGLWCFDQSQDHSLSGTGRLSWKWMSLGAFLVGKHMYSRHTHLPSYIVMSDWSRSVGAFGCWLHLTAPQCQWMFSNFQEVLELRGIAMTWCSWRRHMFMRKLWWFINFINDLNNSFWIPGQATCAFTPRLQMSRRHLQNWSFEDL